MVLVKYAGLIFVAIFGALQFTHASVLTGGHWNSYLMPTYDVCNKNYGQQYL